MVGFYVPINLPKDAALLSLQVRNNHLTSRELISTIDFFGPQWRIFKSYLQAKSLGIDSNDKSGMIESEASHEVKILHENKTSSLEILEIASDTELPCNQVKNGET